MPYRNVRAVNDLSLDLFLMVLENLERGELYRCLLVSRAWNTTADADVLWQPIAQRLLRERLCLLPDVHAAISAATPTSAVCRHALGRAFADAKRCTITADELCSLSYKFRFLNFYGPSTHGLFAMSPVRANFFPDGRYRSAPGEDLQVNMTWSFIESAHSYRMVPGSSSFQPPPPDLPPPDFTCVLVEGRPPLRVWRHPQHWGVVMTNHRAQIASFDIPPLGSDEALDSDQPFLHPWCFQNRLEDDDDDDEEDGADSDDTASDTTQNSEDPNDFTGPLLSTPVA
jgi:hypothetical protein